MIKLGVLDFDTSHVVEFTKRLNHKGIAEDQWVNGAQVVIGCPGKSEIMPERIPGHVKEMKQLGVELVDKPEEMIGKVDGMLIESQEGGAHWPSARPFLEAGIPCYIDKPFTCSVADARKIIDLADKKKAAIFSSSSLRYATELVQYVKENKHGAIIGCVAYGPAPLFEKDSKLNTGLYHYGIHAVEILYTLMGPGCQRVTCTHEKDVDVATGQWMDGRTATVRGIRKGKKDYGALVFTENEVHHITISGANIYRELVKKIVEMFETKKSPLDIHETLEVVAFIEAANKSGSNHGAGEALSL